MAWKVGDIGWRGYARHYGNPQEWWPEIRPARVVEVAADGTLRLHMEGVMPGMETKRNPGGWITWNFDPSLLHKTPEAALRYAKSAAASANAEAKTRQRNSESETKGTPTLSTSTGSKKLSV